MLLTYHDELLQNSIPNNYFDDLSQFKYVTNSLLMAGLHYPDVPCNDLVITTDNKVKYLNYNTCRIPLPLIYLFDEQGNGLKQTVQSHRGRQAIGHSMTFNPDTKMIDVRQKILRRIEILYMLALSDNSLLSKCQNAKCEICYTTLFSKYECPLNQPNIFWVGQILHCIQDSYSRVHTLRTTNPTQRGGAPETNDYSDKEKTILSFKLVKMVGDLFNDSKIQLDNVKLHTKEDIVAFLLQHITDSNLQSIIRKHPNDISHIFKLTLFFKNQKTHIVKLFQNNEWLPSTKNIKNHKSQYPNYPYLQSFRYIGHQTKCGRGFHMSYDTQKESVAFQPFIIDNCNEVLIMFKRHIQQQPADMPKNIEEMINYIAANVFPIYENYQDQPSAKLCSPSGCECNLGSPPPASPTLRNGKGGRKKIRTNKHRRKRYFSKTRSNRK